MNSCQRSFIESKSQRTSSDEGNVKVVKDRLLKANHNREAERAYWERVVKDRLLKANHNLLTLWDSVAVVVKDRLLKANHNVRCDQDRNQTVVKDRLLKANHNFVPAAKAKILLSKIVY